jgi:peptidoglycan/xylan/chitin deacetylase (PgdA/CDA1 family)
MSSSRLLATILLAALSILPGAAWGQAAPIRFLLTFDDGPSAAVTDNSTAQILDTLHDNPLQPGIKAIFFVQTRARNGGATPVGRQLLRREYDSGHVLALHTATPRHANHRLLPEQELEDTLKLGIADLADVTGSVPLLVRPPFWNYDERTLATYHRHGLQMLLTSLSANDGVIYGYYWSWTKRSNMRKLLLQVRERWLAGAMPQVDGSTPVVVTFHDINRYTASVMQEYLQILVDVARELEIPTADKPFYDERAPIERAALASTIQPGQVVPPLPGIWEWLWR